MTHITEHFGERIRRARRAANMNQAALARAIGVTRAAVSFWENGHSAKIEASNLNRLCKKLKVSHDYILNGIGPAPTPARLDDEPDMTETNEHTPEHETDDDQILRLLDDLTTGQRTLYLLHLRELAEMSRRVGALEEAVTAPEPAPAIDTSALDELAAVLAKLKGK